MASNKALVPEAKKALDQFKMEAATEVGVTLNQGYNGDLTARQAGSIGGQTVKKMKPVPNMKIEHHKKITPGKKKKVKDSFFSSEKNNQNKRSTAHNFGLLPEYKISCLRIY